MDFSNAFAQAIQVTAANCIVEDVEIVKWTSDKTAGTPLIGTNQIIWKSIASVDPLPLDPNYDRYNVTGTVNFNTISGGSGGRRIWLKFAGALTITDAAGNINLGANFTTTANDTLVLEYDGAGAQWLQFGGSVN
jgi:hypothetical protein